MVLSNTATRAEPAPLAPAEVSSYLKRLGYAGDLAPSLENLNALQRAHLLRIPFENLDIHLGRPIHLDVRALLDKVVERRRGGYCYELNGLFAALLRALGYEVQLLSGRVAHQDGTLGAEFDHLTLEVTSSEVGKAHLVDVGFGDAFLRPLPLESGYTRQEGHKALRLECRGDAWEYAEDCGQGFQVQYAFGRVPRKLEDFEAMNHYQQTSPASHFTRKRICTLATPNGRVTLSDQRLITTVDGAKAEREVNSEELSRVLRERFGVVL